MGWTILYIAFGLVSLWLLGEVLLQYKARLRWRLLAFAGFLGVVVGVIIPSVIVIGVGAIAFAIGQTNVTLSFKRGFTTGWALGGKPGESRRRRGRAGGPPAAEPTLQVSDLEEVSTGEMPVVPPGPGAGGGQDTFESTGGFASTGGFQSTGGFPSQDTYAGRGSYDYGAGDGYRGQDPYQDQQDQSVFATQAFPAPSYDQPAFADRDDYARTDATAVYAPQPMPEETGQYGIYSADARAPQNDYPGYDAYGTADSGSSDGNGYAYGGSYGQPAAGQDGYADPYAAYGDSLGGQGQQAPYSDPYNGTQQYSAPYDSYAQPDPYAQSSYGAQQYDSQGRPLDQNPGQGYGETPADGVWVPQQRESELPPEQPPYPGYQQQGYDGQHYRY